MSKDSGSTMKDGRSHAEYLGDTRVRFHHPCGHSSTKDYGRGPVSKRLGEVGTKKMASWWSKEKGGVTAPCPTCAKKRDGHTGRYLYSGDMNRVCRCGHTLGVHCAGAPHDCFGPEGNDDDACPCERFRPVKE